MKKIWFLLKLMLFLVPVIFTLACDDDDGDSNEDVFNAPSNLAAVVSSSTQIDLSWTDNANCETGFIIERSADSGSFAELATVSANTTSYSDDDVQEDTSYTYRLKAYRDNEETDCCDSVSVTIDSSLPIAPSSLTATAISNTTIRLSWSDNSDNETGFELARRTGSGDFSTIETLSINATSFTDSSLSADTTYTYRIRSINDNGESGWSETATATTQNNSETLKFVADHTVAKESVLRSIPESAINTAKRDLHIMYCGTSHSSQVRDGMNHLQSYKTGDDALFAVSFDGEQDNDSTLDMDYRPNSPVNVYGGASDLSQDSVDSNGFTNYYYETIEYLDHAEHADVNVVMWSWCSIENHDVQIYINNFDQLIEMYSAGGSKGRTAENSVTFVWMTGYARGSDGIDPDAEHSPYYNHKRIVDHCIANNYFCLDYWSHDTHDYETDEFYPTALGNSPTHLLTWMNNNPDDWYECDPAHAAAYDLLGNRRAYAAWWLWARIAGWDGISTE